VGHLLKVATLNLPHLHSAPPLGWWDDPFWISKSNCGDIINSVEWQPNSPNPNLLDYHVRGGGGNAGSLPQAAPKTISGLKDALQWISTALP